MIIQDLKSRLFYKIYPEKELMFEYWQGLIDRSDDLNFKHNFIKDKLYNPNYNLIVDRRNSTLSLENNDLNILKSYLKSNNPPV